jgi:hypothetical protein
LAALIEGLGTLRAGGNPTAVLDVAVGGFRRLGAGTLEAWARSAQARRALQVDRYHDALWRTLVRACDQAGDPAASARARRDYEALLLELGLPPSTNGSSEGHVLSQVLPGRVGIAERPAEGGAFHGLPNLPSPW